VSSKVNQVISDWERRWVRQEA